MAEICLNKTCLDKTVRLGKTVSIMVMVYNEAPTLRQAVEEVLEAMELTDVEGEVVIIDDGGTDGSAQIADQLADQHEVVRVIHHEVNLGMGGVYRTAFREAKNAVLYFMAADLQPIPKLYFETFLPLLADHDVVVGFEPKRDVPFLSRFLSWGEGLLFKILYPGVPKIGGPLMFRRALLELELRLTQPDDRSWMILWELMIRAKRAGFRFTSVPTRRRARAQGSSRGSTLRNAFIMLKRLLALRRALVS